MILNVIAIEFLSSLKWQVRIWYSVAMLHFLVIVVADNVWWVHPDERAGRASRSRWQRHRHHDGGREDEPLRRQESRQSQPRMLSDKVSSDKTVHFIWNHFIVLYFFQGYFVFCSGFCVAFNIWGLITKVPACSSVTLTIHRNTITEDMTSCPNTVHKHWADLLLCYPSMLKVTLEPTTTRFNVLGQSQPRDQFPTFHIPSKSSRLFWWHSQWEAQWKVICKLGTCESYMLSTRPHLHLFCYLFISW